MKQRSPATGSHPDEFRMTLGEHLDELRGCLVRSLLALVGGCLLCAWPAKYVLAWTVQPLLLALRNHGQPDSLLATSPTEPFIWYIKIVVFLGLTIASPYVIHQIWSFVAKGLYRGEKRIVYRLAPASAGLFVFGVVFMYVFVLFLSLNFLVGFGSWLPLPDVAATPIQALLGGITDAAPSTQSGSTTQPAVAILRGDPASPQAGQAWINLDELRLKVRGSNETFAVHLQRDDQRGMVTTHFRIGEYLTFVLILAVGFGLAFQVPLVVVFLVRSGIMRRETLAGSRKIVILAIVILAGALAPPDLVSHLMLSVPMILLFELGLWLTRNVNKPARSGSITGPS